MKELLIVEAGSATVATGFKGLNKFMNNLLSSTTQQKVHHQINTAYRIKCLYTS
jgi:hypothetical protein